MKEDRPHFIERSEPLKTPEAVRKNRSNAMIVIGALLFVLAVASLNAYPDGGAGPILFGILAVGLIVGGLVVRR